MSATRLTPEQYHHLAEAPLRSVFKGLDLGQELFQEAVSERFIAGDLDGYIAEEQLYEAICRAAQAVGDDRVFYSVIRGYDDGLEQHSWVLTLFDYEAYAGVPYYDRRIHRHEDVGIPLERVMYSPTGQWGILFPELFVIVGGSREFADALKRYYPKWRRDLNAFLRRFHEAKERRGVDVSWVLPLLGHLYGDDAPPFNQ